MYLTSQSLKCRFISDFIQGPTSFRMGLPLASVRTSPASRMSCEVWRGGRQAGRWQVWN